MLRDEESNSSRIVSPPKICVNTSSSCNNSNQDKSINTSAVLDFENQDILIKISLKNCNLQGKTEIFFIITSALTVFMNLELKDIFCSDAVFNLSRRILTETEIQVLEKGLNFAPIQNKINEPE